MTALGDLVRVLDGLGSLASVIQGELARFHSGMVALAVTILAFQVVAGLGRAIAGVLSGRTALAGLVVQGALVGVAVVLLSGRILEGVGGLAPLVRLVHLGP